jgi:hypothetical protein
MRQLQGDGLSLPLFARVDGSAQLSAQIGRVAARNFAKGGLTQIYPTAIKAQLTPSGGGRG